MTLTAKERMARWREKTRLDPVAHEIYKQKERERNQKRKESGELQGIVQMTPREQRVIRKRWRQHSKIFRDKCKATKNMLTPPNSPLGDEHSPPPALPEIRRSDSMKKTLKRKRNKEISRCYRENEKLRIKLKFQGRLTEKYKKRYNRMKNKHIRKKETNTESKFMVKSYKLYKTLVENIRHKYKTSKSQADKRNIANLVVRQRILKQYGISCSYAQSILRFSRRHLSSKPKRRPNIQRLKMKQSIIEYFERDDVSTVKAGKKSTITRKGVKKQIRFLNDDLKNLHEKFRSENNTSSYSLFCKLRPFWVVKPEEKDRETCMCKIHENLNFKLETAKKTALCPVTDIDKLVKVIVCDENEKACMYRECSICKGKTIDYNVSDSGEQVSWSCWKSIRVEKTVTESEKPKIVTRTIKATEQGTKEVLAKEITTELNRACRHIFNIRRQYKTIRYIRKNMTHEEIVAHIDFSENYACKYASEIQSMHFGGSRRQISLHTGVLYLSNQLVSFCTASDCLKHGPSAIWAHMDPVLKYINRDKRYKYIHFVSDGPTTQYRNKQNFYLWGHKLQEYGFSKSTWNFLEASHGKGAADGIGGAVKRMADSRVNVQKKDITCAKDFVNAVSTDSSDVKLFLVDEESINAIEAELPASLKPVPKTMKIHQLILETPLSFAARDVSCFCSHPDALLCRCYQPEVSILAPKKDDVNVPATDQEQDQLSEETTTLAQVLRKVSNIDESLVGSHCVVAYDKLPYPGVILDVDEDEAEVKVMHRIGVNRFFWPSPIEDRLWYNRNDIITLLESEPMPVTNRNCKLPQQIWDKIVSELKLDEFGK